jgi:tetratricopeptide (TPR) repeat protein
VSLPRHRSLFPLVLGATLIAAIVAAYAFSLRGGFLWDDDLHITANPTIIGPLGLKEIWTSARANYFPLVLTNFWVQHALWGLEPLGYRIVTLAFHAFAAVLLWRVLRQLRIPGAWLGAAFWALHPVQVESVAWICELKNTQSAVFFLAALWAYVRWIESLDAERDPAVNGPVRDSPFHRRDVRRYYALALLCALLALLSKPSTVMLPVALLLCSWWLRGRFSRGEFFPLLPFFALSAVAAGWTIWEQKVHSGAIGPEWSQTFLERIAIAGRAIWFYLGKLAWPEPLMFIYPRWTINSANVFTYLAPGLALAGLAAVWWRRQRAFRPLLFAFGFFVALLFPVLGFFSVYFFRYSFVGDHFQYLASIGPLALAAAGLARYGGRAVPLIGGCLLLALGLVTERQSRVYHDNEALWRDTVAHNPAAVMAWLNLADTLAQAGRYDESIATFQRAISIRPDDPHGHNDLGNVLILVGRPAEALPHFERALVLKPDMADALSNFGNALRSLGRSAEAIAKYRRAIELKPDHSGALNNLGAELAQTGKAQEAIPLFQRALKSKPADPALHDNLAGAWRELGRFDNALAEHQEALRLKSDSAEAHVNYGRTLVAAGKIDEALRHFERALEIKPTLVAARSNYASALGAAGRGAEGFAQLVRAVELSPNSAEAQQNLGAALAQSGRTEEAVACFEKALELAPDFAAARLNLGTAYLALARWGKAIAQFKAALTLLPDSATARAQLAVALVNDDQLGAAVPHFEAALRLNPQAADVHDNFGQVLNALGRKREAFEHLEEAARLRRERGR